MAAAESGLLRACRGIGTAAIVATMGVAATGGQALALEFDVGGGVTGTWDSDITYASMFRVQDQDAELLRLQNNDDGNRNFDKGLVSNLGKYSTDFQLSYGNFGLFTRAFAFWDTEIARGATNDHDNPLSNNAGPIYGGTKANNLFTRATSEAAGTAVELRDLFVYGNVFEDTGHKTSFRLGQQVVNWGENAFIQTGIASFINPADVSKANLPGTEVKEILLPVPTAWLSVGVVQNVNLEVYYQFRWRNTIAPAHGTYLSENDLVADGATSLLVPFQAVAANPLFAGLGAGAAAVAQFSALGRPFIEYDRGLDNSPGHGGQWGAAIRYYADWLNSTELGFYVINYHDKLPVVSLARGPGFLDTNWAAGAGGFGALGGILNGQETSQYFLEYIPDVKLYAVSFNTNVLGDWAISGELGYHHDRPVQTRALAASAPGAPTRFWTRENVMIGQASIFRQLGATYWAESTAWLTEIGVQRVIGKDDGQLFLGANPVDNLAWGLRSQFAFSYFDVLPRWIMSSVDLNAIVNISADIDGDSAIPGPGFKQDAKAIGLIAEFNWLNKVQLALGYNNFFGSGSNIRDRDNVTVTAKYRW